MASRYFVRAAEVPDYQPANHTGTWNKRLIGRETVGAGKLEMILGTVTPGQGARRTADNNSVTLKYTTVGVPNALEPSATPSEAC